MQRIFGNQALIVTPMLESGAIDESGLKNVIDYTIEGGADGIIILGSTGEFFSLTEAERRHVMSLAATAVNGRVPYAFGAAGTGAKAVIDDVRVAADLGADYVLTPPPFYSPGTFLTPEGMFSFYAEVAAATSMSVMMYDGGSAIEIPLDVMERIGRQFPHARMVKVNVQKPKKVKLLNDVGLVPFCGIDTLSLPMLRYGAAGYTLASGAILPGEASRVFSLFNSGEHLEASKLFCESLLPIVNSTLGLYSEFVASCKLLLHWKGLISSPTVRPPLVSIDDVRAEELRTVAKLSGFI